MFFRFLQHKIWYSGEKESLHKEMENFQRTITLKRQCELLRAKSAHLEVESDREQLERMRSNLAEGEAILKRKKSIIETVATRN